MRIDEIVNLSYMETADSLHFGTTTEDPQGVVVFLVKDGTSWYVRLSLEEFQQGVRMVFSSLGN